MISVLEFRNKFTLEEKRRIYQAAGVNIDVQIWLDDLASVKDSEVDLNNPKTIEGVIAIEQAGLLDAGRTASDILGQPAVIPSQSLGGFTVGDSVRVLSPFNISYPDIYTIVSVSGESINIDGVDFAPNYLEKV